MNEPSQAPPSHDRRTLWLILIGLVVAWSAYLAIWGPRVGSGPLPEADLRTPRHPKRADFRWMLSDLDGRVVDFDRYRGRTIFLNLWATWCPPCVAEMPSIDSLAANERLRDVVFLCVAVDDANSVKSFVKRKALKVPVLVAQQDVPEPFVTKGIPATFIINAEGEIVVERVGSAGWDSPEVVDFLASLAAGEKAEDGSSLPMP